MYCLTTSSFYRKYPRYFISWDVRFKKLKFRIITYYLIPLVEMNNTFTENLDSKCHLLAYLETMAWTYLLGIKLFLFLKIASWNFQHLFEKEFHETSQNFNSIRLQIEKMEIKIAWMSLKVSAFYLEKKKVLFQKQIWFKL